ncbi:Uncharacterized protein HZ326_19285 [Fusarium oxysporum f. sp. albedinis]|nr:Uncharacterized protein HZ326_19285 [Fusarium oxysporum f. sp. albedinis]
MLIFQGYKSLTATSSSTRQYLCRVIFSPLHYNMLLFCIGGRLKILAVETEISLFPHEAPLKAILLYNNNWIPDAKIPTFGCCSNDSVLPLHSKKGRALEGLQNARHWYPTHMRGNETGKTSQNKCDAHVRQYEMCSGIVLCTKVSTS